MKKFQVATYDQHLTCNGRDLNDNQATLASLRIFPGTVIILQVNNIFLLFRLELTCFPLVEFVSQVVESKLDL